jgi:hypothetical protein
MIGSTPSSNPPVCGAYQVNTEHDFTLRPRQISVGSSDSLPTKLKWRVLK